MVDGAQVAVRGAAAIRMIVTLQDGGCRSACRLYITCRSAPVKAQQRALLVAPWARGWLSRALRRLYGRMDVVQSNTAAEYMEIEACMHASVVAYAAQSGVTGGTTMTRRGGSGVRSIRVRGPCRLWGAQPRADWVAVAALT